MTDHPIDSQALAFFRTPEGERLLLRVAPQAGDADGQLQLQERLRADYPAPICRAVIAMAQLRWAARDKFPRAACMYFDREGLEMATRDEVARYRASRFAGCDPIVDLCCGIGGDTLALAAHARVIAVDSAPLRLDMARMNAAAVGIDPGRILFVRADARRFSARAEAAFIDPARREAGRRVRSVEAYTPPLSCVADLRHTIPRVAVKLAPGIRAVDLPVDAEVEFISSARQCREALVSYPPLARTRRRATVLPGPHFLEESDSVTPPVAVESAGSYLYDPDPAVVRAGLIDRLAVHLDAWKLDARTAYLTSDGSAASPFAQAFRVLWDMPFNLKRLRRALAQQGQRAEEIKKRHFPIEPEDMRRLLAAKEDRGGDPLHAVTLVLTRIAGRPHAFVCERVGK